ncbi:unnamed protein product [Chilo suppressalis]|uniref:RRM domain-containing protein n=1 Tax=Chilo suppressalis TaxID=168631 RepID=A0ABN8ATW7_CHISP|nr:unnamed protein product [Chilo suppressalis]
MCSESVPKNFEKASDILPLLTYGLTSVKEFCKAEEEKSHQEWLKKAGLDEEELHLLNEIQSDLPKHSSKIESSILNTKLESIRNKISNLPENDGSSKQNDQDLERHTSRFYPKGHPMHQLKELEENIFGHLKDDRLPITKRRKILRHLERKQERTLSKQILTPVISDQVNQQMTVNRHGSLWDVKEIPPTTSVTQSKLSLHENRNNEMDGKGMSKIGPRQPTMYTVKENKIVRLEPLNDQDEVKAVDIVIPVNSAEVQLLEGTKMSLNNIRKIDRFKGYEPGIPSKVLYLKNIAPSVTQDRLSSLFKQFVYDNGGPIDVRLMSGRMRGQAFVAFQNETMAKQALEDVNGTIIKGRPVIIQFGKNSNRIQTDKNR